jgi:hypothetical protein
VGALAGATILVVGAAVLPLGVRWALLPLALTAPGAAIVDAVFPPGVVLGVAHRLGLSTILSLAVYPILALAVFSTATPMSHRTVAVSTWLACAAAAAVSHVRSRTSVAPPLAAEGPPGGLRLRPLALPAAAVTAAALVAWASVAVLPRAAPAPHVDLALDGAWALASGVVPVDAEHPVAVQVLVVNATPSDRTIELLAEVDGVTAWQPVARRVRPGDRWHATLTGTVPADACRARLEIGTTGADGRELAPLAVTLRDRSAECDEIER